MGLWLWFSRNEEIWVVDRHKNKIGIVAYEADIFLF